MKQSRPSGRLRVTLRRRRGTAAAAVLLLAVTAAGAGEFAARDLVESRIAKAAPALGSDVTVSESGGPLLWDLVNQHIPQLDINSDDAQVGPLRGVSVQVRLDDVRLGGEAGRASDSGTHVQVTVPTQSVAAAIQTAVPDLQVASVTADPASGTIVAAVGPGGLGQLTLRPTLKDGRASLAVAGLSVFGHDIPTSELGGAAEGLGAAAGPQTAYPLGLRTTSAQVVAQGLRITLTGGPSTLEAS